MRKIAKYKWCLICILLISTLVIACGDEKSDVVPQSEYEMATVRLALHSNESASIVAIAIENGYFEKYGIDLQLAKFDAENLEIEMASMRSDNRNLDIGYIDSSEAWQAINPSGNQISYVFFDSLINAPHLLAVEGMFEDDNSDGIFDVKEVYQGLKGQTVFMEVGSITGTWFWELIDTINAGKKYKDQLWVECDALLDYYEKFNDKPECKVVVVNSSNADIPDNMFLAGDNAVKIAVSFPLAPKATGLELEHIISITDNAKLPSLKVSSGAWVASNEWIEEEPEVVQRVINALYEGAIERAADIQVAMEAAEILCERSPNSFDTRVLTCPTKLEYQDWFAAQDSLGYEYMKLLYDASKGFIPEGETPKSFDETLSMSFFLKAIKNIL